MVTFQSLEMSWYFKFFSELWEATILMLKLNQLRCCYWLPIVTNLQVNPFWCWRWGIVLRFWLRFAKRWNISSKFQKLSRILGIFQGFLESFQKPIGNVPPLCNPRRLDNVSVWLETHSAVSEMSTWHEQSLRHHPSLSLTKPEHQHITTKTNRSFYLELLFVSLATLIILKQIHRFAVKSYCITLNSLN